MGDVINKCPTIYNPLTKSCFVDTIPGLQTDKINSLVGCSTTMTTGNWGPKDANSPQVSLRPPKTDFITSFVDYNTPYETLFGYNKQLQVNYSSKVLSNLNSRPGDRFKFHIWEISDYDENRDLIRTYIENTQIILLCFISIKK
jgi:GTPase SAR1 family protein